MSDLKTFSIKELNAYIDYQNSVATMMLKRGEYQTACGNVIKDSLDGHDEAIQLIKSAEKELADKEERESILLESRIDECQSEANEAFWAVVVEHFPECKTGDFLMDCDNPQLEWIDHWVNNNKPA